ncbi:Calx-beta domain-containing protein [Kordia jejudonensis]|uniref:Calx-beta domain-containing protein n=1 Tax=Kordia jejudonensis TaxID=1348245 RepID=UPI0006297532|nr:Calx-beta domain-containing protein [Kordia jejudonensis]
MKKIISILSCIVVLSFFSCENDDNAITTETEDPQINSNFEENFGTAITARFLGRVVNEQKEPVQGATIRIGNTTTTTDLFGIFSVDAASAYEKFAYITAEKDGYIAGSRALAPSASEVNRVEIMLLKEDIIATINTGEQATVNLSNGTEVTFDGNYTKADGSAYSGEVKVVLKHLSPDDANMQTMMPGMLFAQNASGGAVALETYGMLAVELKSGTGEELQLADGSASQISMPLAANASNPPATIPLWYFDEIEGYWVEEGEATLQGNKYVGDVSHFTFWNYDYPYPSIYLCIELIDEEGDPMPYTPVDLYSSLLNTTGTYGYTNGNGLECGLVPSGEELIVTVPNISCTGEPFTTTIGPFTNDTTTTIVVSDTNQNATTLTGTFVTCDGNNVTDGYLQLFLDSQTLIIPVTDGTFDYTITYCGSLNYSIKGIDIANNQVTDVTTGTFSGEITVDLGALSSCTGFVDTDGDGIFDSFEDVNGDNDLSNDDTDNDGIPNYQDADDDGDGINTADEDYDGDNDPTNDDSDGDQIPDYLDPIDVLAFTAEALGVGCDPVQFDLVAAATQFGNDLHTYEFYLTQADATAQTSPLNSPFGVSIADLVGNTQMVFVVATNNATGQTAIGELYLYWSYEDSDGDGLTDCEETTGIDNPSTGQVPNGTSDPNDPSDPFMPELSITHIASVDEGVGTANMHVFLNYASNTDTTINMTTTDGTAISPDDYTATALTITIPSGSLSATIPIPIIDDSIVESLEEFTVSGTVTSGNTSNTTVQGTVAIYDNDNNGNFPQTGTLESCDDGSGSAIIDLSTMDGYYSVGIANVSYHYTLADADANLNSINLAVQVSDGDIFYVRIDDQGVIQVATLVIVLYPIPSAPAGLSLTACDGNGDGIATFSLIQLDAQIIQNQNPAEIIVTYYETVQDANTQVNPLVSPYTNINTSQTIFYRVENINSGGCFSIGTVDLIVDSGC